MLKLNIIKKVTRFYFILIPFQIICNEGIILKFFINTKSCNSCDLLRPGLEKIKRYNIKKIYLFEEDNKDVVKDIIKIYSLDTTNYTIDYVQRGFFDKNNESFIHLIHNNKLIDSFSIRSLLFKIKWIDSLHNLSKNYLDSIPFPSNIKLSNNINFHYYNNRLTVTDLTLNKLYHFNFNADLKKINLEFEINFNDFNSEPLKNNGCINRKLFEIMKEGIELYGKIKPEIRFSYHDSDNLYVIFFLTSPFISEKTNDTLLGLRHFIYKKKLSKNHYDCYCLDKDGISSPLIDNSYHISSEFIIHYKNDTFLVPPVVNNGKKRPLFLKYVTDKSKEKLVYVSSFFYLDQLLPDNFSFNYKNKKYIYRMFNNRFYYFPMYPLFSDIEKNKHYFINNKYLMDELENKGGIYDVQIKNNERVRILFYSKTKEKFLIQEYTINDNSLAGELPITLHVHNPTTMPRFLSENCILFLSNKFIYIFKF